jgi:hypothetical protein
VKEEIDRCVHKLAGDSSDSCFQDKGLNSNMQLVKTYSRPVLAKDH